MKKAISIRKLEPTEKDLILKIANWYYEEWNTPIEKTIRRLSTQAKDDLFFQLILTRENKPIATGGLCNNVNILNVHPQLNKFGPWVALLYTDKDYRGQGYGEALLRQIESCAIDSGLVKIYLYTFTAEALYKRCGWKVTDQVVYKNQETVIMEKELLK